jgi:hypothetical protein
MSQLATFAAQEAIKAERERIQAIEAIAAAVGDTELVNEAKFGGADGKSACTAQELSFKAMQKQAALGAAHLANVRSDYTASGAGAVGAAPNSGDSPAASLDDGKTVEELEAIAKASVDALLGKAGKEGKDNEET